MTGPARMKSEREAELRAVLNDDSGGRVVHNRPIITELLDALAAERAHAQQVEKRAQRWESRARHLITEDPLASATVLGYGVVADYDGSVLYGDPDNNWDRPYATMAAAAQAASGDASGVVVALIQVAPDGRPVG